MQKISTRWVAIIIFFGLVPTVYTPKQKSTVTMKFSSYALAAAVVASVVNGFAGPQVTPRFALQVRAPWCVVAVWLWQILVLQQQQQQQWHYRHVYPRALMVLKALVMQVDRLIVVPQELAY
jgi:FtsH-binding integral membrane protein